MTPQPLLPPPGESDTATNWGFPAAVSFASLFESLATKTRILVADALCGFARMFTTARVFGVENLLPARGGARLLIANHSSHADFLLLLSALPTVIRASARPVAAADYWQRGPFRRFLAERIFRAVLVSRTDFDRRRHPLNAMMDALQQGDSLILFPEGTRGDGAQLGEFRCGVFHLLQHAPNVEIIPVWLHNVHRALPRGAILPLPVPCGVAFGEPMVIALDQDKSAVLNALRQQLRCLGDQCQSWMQT